MDGEPDKDDYSDEEEKEYDDEEIEEEDHEDGFDLHDKGQNLGERYPPREGH